MSTDARALLELTDDLLATEQPVPRFLAALWSDALAGVAPGAGPGDDLDPDAGELPVAPGGS